MQPPNYSPDAVKPMRDELTAVGFEELLTSQDVDQALKNKGTVLCVINSVCGCAAGAARPAVGLALQNKVIPDRLVTVFAGMEHEAVAKVRQHHAHVAPPSSPAVILFKDGKVTAMLERHQIQGRGPDELAEELAALFTKQCSKTGPSIPPEKFAQLKHIQACGSKIPRSGQSS